MNRLCGSGVQAIISGAQTIALGEAHIVVTGGALTPSIVTTVKAGRTFASICFALKNPLP